jgi:hypothetical protein
VILKMSAANYLSDPHVQYLWQILDDLGNGLIQVPRFQRPLVWDLDRRLELLRSIRDGIPLGAIMLWRTTHTAVSCYDSFGPYKIPPPPQGSSRQYLLDGVQRLSTLYAALYRPATDASTDEPIYTFYYDLDKEDFVGIEVSEDVEDWGGSCVFPLTILFDESAFPLFQRQLEGDCAAEWISRSTKLSRAFQKYKVPIVPISTDDIDLAAKTFDRVNKQGVEVSEMDMIHALTYSDDFALREHIDDIRQEALGRVGWEDVKPAWILDACKAALGLDIYETEARELSQKLKKDPETLAVVSQSMKRAARFLKDRCDVPSPGLVPYAFQAIFITEAFRVQPEPCPEVLKTLHAWFWLTTLGEAFAGISGYRTSLVAEDIRQMAQDGKPRWSFPRPFQYRTLPARSTFRSVRVKALVLRLAALKNNGADILSRHHNKALGHLVRRSEVDSLFFSNLGNRLLIDPGTLDLARELLRDGSDLVSLAEHVISDEAFQYFQAGYYRRFVETRLEDLRQFEAQFVQDLQETFDVDDSSKA